MVSQFYDRASRAVWHWLIRRLPTCQEMSSTISESMERRLTLRERALVRLHLRVCIWCVWYLEHLRTMRDALRARAAKVSDSESSSTSLSSDARERLKRSLIAKDQ